MEKLYMKSTRNKEAITRLSKCIAAILIAVEITITTTDAVNKLYVFITQTVLL